MNSFFVVFICTIFSPILIAETFTSSIHSITYGSKKESHIIRFNNGRVGFLDRGDNDLLQAITKNRKRIEEIRVDLDLKNKIISAQSLERSDLTDMEVETSLVSEPFVPSVVKNYDRALTIFNRMRRDYDKDGECFNRAHIWSYEEFKRSGLNSMKVFMFFTERYIRKYNFEWWFHVTPMVYVANKNSPYTLDRRYSAAPRQTKMWSDIFIKSKLRCPKIKLYDDFWLNQKRNDCYLLHTSMYYLIPRDIEKRDLSGVEKTEFYDSELKKAYKNGFNKNFEIMMP